MSARLKRLELTWIGKEDRPRLEPRILLEDEELSYAKRVSNEDLFDNRLIHGDNLLALKALEQEFAGKIKCVYIDPPFNTGQAFEHYDDGLEHSLWLTLMRDRLELIHRLLAADGTLFVHIDDNELGYLTVLCDEIFGRPNRTSLVTFKQGAATGHKAINPGCVSTANYILIYAKNKDLWAPNRLFTARERDDRYNQFIPNVDDAHSAWEIVSLTKAYSEHASLSEKDARARIRSNPEEIDEFVASHAEHVIRLARPDYKAVSKEARALIDESKKKPDEVLHLPREDHKDFYFIRGERILFYKHKLKEIDGQLVAGEPLTTIWDDLLSNNLHNEGDVNFPKGKKPEALLKRVIEMSTNPGDWVLDSFGGSGTTGAVAHKMQRRWIMVELGEHCHTHCLPRLTSVVNGGDESGVCRLERRRRIPLLQARALAPREGQVGQLDRQQAVQARDARRGDVQARGLPSTRLTASLLEPRSLDRARLHLRHHAEPEPRPAPLHQRAGRPRAHAPHLLRCLPGQAELPEPHGEEDSAGRPRALRVGP
jgi:adenine-specific DNA-methyltransferase